MLHQNIISKDTIFITDLIVNTTIGCVSWEQAFTQPVIINISITTNFSNKINTKIDMQSIINLIIEICQANIFDSLECLVVKLEELIIARYLANILAMQIGVKKSFPAANIKEIGVIIARTYN